MGQILGIAELGHEVLRIKSDEVDNIKSMEVKKLIDDMIATVNDAQGVGIAAPQVYHSKRIFIIKSSPNSRYPYAPEIGPVAIINPRIITYSEEKVTDWEGCLSIPGIRALVPRFKSIEAEYYTRDGKYHKQEFTDFVARIFQHELDHLNGIVFLDRIESSKDIVTEKEFQKLVQK
jgi:peptide deformylase